ncbi:MULTISPECIES: DUF6609 family protein [Planococcus]|nr:MULTISPECIES: DUF6609 family protein [Planococcus]PKG45468.1 hypothetical protein CXF66_12705 [Planococcus sp. Urea-trap-24]PKG88935.1 hypothetical protein CXF91_08830 [Planococcus sp. Urea-3u-39]PKH36303.1 hypothetical protein CXF77_14500 [Planococcus sp. MB-3u-09]
MTIKSDDPIKYPTQRTSGVWLLYIGMIIIAAALAGGPLLVQPVLLGAGYAIGFVLILALPFVNRKLAYGKNSKFQDRFENIAIFLNIALCTACGLIVGFSDLRVFWLSLFIAVGIHFVLFYFSQGSWMVVLAILTIGNGVLGLLLVDVPFLVFAIIDGGLKMAIGIKLLLQKHPSFKATKQISA